MGDCVFTHIYFWCVQTIAVSIISPKSPQSLLVNCQVHSSISVPSIVVLSRWKAAYTVFWRCLKMACSSTCLAAAKQGSGLQGWMLHQCSAIWELLLHHRSSELGMSPTLRVTVRYEGSLASIGESILSHLTRLSILSCGEKHRGNSERRGLSEPARLKDDLRW